MADWSDFSFEIVRGDDHTEEFVIESGDPLAPVDISGYLEIWLIGRRRPGDTDAVFTLTKTAGGIVYSTSGTDGKLKAKIPGTATTALPNWRQTIFADLQIKDGGGNIGTPSQGTITVKPEIVTATS